MVASALETGREVNTGQPGKVIELFRSPDSQDVDSLLGLSTEAFNGSDRASQWQTLKTIRRRSYNPNYQVKMQELYPSGETEYPTSPLESIEFDVMAGIMVHRDSPVTPEQLEVLGFLHGIGPEEAVDAIREEDRLRNGLDRLTARYEIGGYKMGRQVIRAIDVEIELDKSRAQYLHGEIARLGTDAYLSADDRDLLKQANTEYEMEQEFRRKNRYGPPANHEADMAVLERHGTKRAH